MKAYDQESATVLAHDLMLVECEQVPVYSLVSQVCNAKHAPRIFSINHAVPMYVRIGTIVAFKYNAYAQRDMSESSDGLYCVQY